MSRSSGRLGWTICTLAIVLLVVGAVVDELLGPDVDESSLVEDVGLMVTFAAFPVMGALIVARHPRHVLGWIFLGLGALSGLGVAGNAYANAAFAEGHDLPVAGFGAWLEGWWWYPTFGSIPTFVLLLFPTGAPPSPRWRVAVWITGISMAMITLPSMLQEHVVADAYVWENPIGISSIQNVEEQFGFAIIGFLLSAILGVASLVVRFLRARGEERQQVKILMFSGAMGALLLTLGDVLLLPSFVFALAVISIPVAIGIAILKYRLYDIDVVVNRALVYGLLTGILAAAYLAIVTGASTFAGDSNLSVAAATLAVAGLFQPLRRRIQGFIDQRFYRRKYDAARTVESFTQRLRDEVDLETLRLDLTGVVAETMQPRFVSLWLRPSREPSQP